MGLQTCPPPARHQPRLQPQPRRCSSTGSCQNAPRCAQGDLKARANMAQPFRMVIFKTRRKVKGGSRIGWEADRIPKFQQLATTGQQAAPARRQKMRPRWLPLRPLKGRDWSRYLSKAAPSAAPRPDGWSSTMGGSQAGADSKISAPAAEEASGHGGAAGVQERALALEA
eukprot:SAG11_NODE_5331_length_1593_cov_2.605087_3_plen_170_part_00